VPTTLEVESGEEWAQAQSRLVTAAMTRDKDGVFKRM
jgi:hypothetical protein